MRRITYEFYLKIHSSDMYNHTTTRIILIIKMSQEKTTNEIRVSLTTYLKSGEATQEEIEEFEKWCGNFAERGKKGRYEAYRFRAVLLRKRRAPFKKSARFIFHDLLKDYMRHISPGEIVNDDPPCNAVEVSANIFVRYVVRYLDDAF